MQQVFDPASVDRRKLDNGMTAIVRVDHSAPVVAIITHLRVGYFNEPDALAGISHVLEHMFFKGTPRRGPGEIAQQTKAAGGLLNAATIYDYTNYYTILPADSLEQGLDIQSDALLNSVIDADELRRELQVIIQEARRKLDNPGAVAAESLYALMFDRHRMRRWRIGTEEFLNALTRDQLNDYYRDMYRGGAVVLVVAGAVDAEQTHALIRHYYNALPAGGAALDHGPSEPERHEFRFAERAGDIVQSHLEIGWHSVPTLHADALALDVLALVLGQGRASRLYRQVREQGLVTSISARNYTPTSVGVFQISVELEPHNTVAALRALGGVLQGLRQGIAEEEVERARSILEARTLRRLESMDGQANFIAEWEALGDWRLGEEYLSQLQRISARDLCAVAEKYLAPEHASIFLYRPEAAPPIGPADEVLRQLRAGAVEAVAPVPVPTRPAQRGRLRSTGAQDEVHEYVSDLGLRIFVKQRSSAPLVAIAYGAAGGSNLESAAQAGWSALVARGSVKGTRRRSAFELALASEARGASISPSVGSDALDWYTSVPSKHLEAALDLLADVALDPTFPAEEIEREKQIALADLQQVRDDMYRYPLRLFFDAAFEGHAYGHSLEATSAAIGNASADDLRAWHRRIAIDHDPALFIVGDVDPERAAGAAAHFFAVSAGARAPAASPVWPRAGAERVEQRSKAQTALVLGYPGVDRNHPDLFPLQVMASAIAGLGGRLFEELRSRKSLAYSVTASAVARQLGGAFISYIAMAPEREEEALAGLLAEMERLRQELLPAAEVERAQRYLIGSHQIRAQTNGAQLTDLFNAMMIGRGLAELREYEEQIRAVTPERIRAAAQRYLDDARQVRAVVRGARSEA